MSACTGDNPLAKACGLSSRTGRQTMVLLLYIPFFNRSYHVPFWNSNLHYWPTIFDENGVKLLLCCQCSFSYSWPFLTCFRAHTMIPPFRSSFIRLSNNFFSYFRYFFSSCFAICTLVRNVRGCMAKQLLMKHTGELKGDPASSSYPYEFSSE